MMKKNEKGITLFIAVVIMAILLFISFAVLNISLKANLFASSGRDSQYAFYAADAGLECALYWDSKHPTYGSAFATTTDGSPINCGGTLSTPNSISTGNTISGTTTTTHIGNMGWGVASVFGFVLNKGVNQASSCAIVTVIKNTDDTTSIQSRGYNTCDTTNPRRVERGIYVTY
jgi:Tfp pilus assembly protein PilX